MKKPKCQVIGENGNVFNIIAIVKKALNDSGQRDKGLEWQKRAIQSKSYDDVLNLMHEYVDVI